MREYVVDRSATASQQLSSLRQRGALGCPPCTTLSTRGFQTMTRGELGKCVCEREIAREM